MHSRRTGGEQDVNIAISSLDVGEIRKREDETKNTNSSSFYDSDLIKDRSKQEVSVTHGKVTTLIRRSCVDDGHSFLNRVG